MKLKFLTFCIVFVMMLSQFAVFASAISDENSPSDKIDSGLAETMEALGNDDYVKVNVRLENYGDTLLYAYLSDRLGEEITKDNEGMYISSVIAEKVADFEERKAEIVRETAETGASSQLTSQTSAVATGNSTLPSQADESNDVNAKIALISEIGDIPATMNSEEVRKMVEAGKSYEEIIDVAERNRFLSEWRNGRSTINKSMGNTFKDKLDMTKCRNIEIDPLLSYVSLECKKSYISEIAAMSEVKEITQYENATISEAEEMTSSSSGETGYHMNGFTDLEYDGSGVRVGVIEKGTSYNANAPHLSGKTIVIVNGSSVQSETAPQHPTIVLSILCGKNVNGYSGVAPGASAYFYGGVTDTDKFKQALYKLAVTNNVSLINASLEANDYSYSDFSKYIDCFIEQYRITFVSATGNDHTYVTSLAMNYNGIAVGNVSNDTDSNGKYIMESGSNYSEKKSYYCEKPDICMFGTEVHMYTTTSSIGSFGTGTSASAPMVTGTVALMMEANPSLIEKPDAIKAMLVNSADNDAISSSSNSTVGTVTATASKFSIASQLKEKSGAGLLNIESALSMASSNMIMYRREFPTNYSGMSGTSFTMDRFYLFNNKTVEATLVFEKAYDNKPTSLSEVKINFDIEVYDDSGNKVASSASTTNNVEAIRLTPVEAGYYTFKTKCIKMDDDSSTGSLVDGSGNSISHNDHDSVFVTFILSCTCESPSGNIGSGNRLQHNIGCTNCGTWAKEENASETATYSDVLFYANYDVRFKVRPFYRDERDVVYFNSSITNTTAYDSSHTVSYTTVNKGQTYDYAKLTKTIQNVFSITSGTTPISSVSVYVVYSFNYDLKTCSITFM